MADYTQTGPFQIVADTGYTFLFSAMYGEEAVSTPFAFTIDLLCEMQTVDGTPMLRQPFGVSLEMDGSTRYIQGLVRKFSELDIQYGTLYGYRVEIVPWLWFLSLAADSRVYENKSVLDIVEDVFKRNNWSDFRVATTGSYPTREYTVQYRETDLQFVSRLLEEEGIFYFFEHTSSKHTLVLADSNSSFQQTPGPDTVSAVQRVVSGTEYQNSVSDLRFDQQVPAGTVTLYDYNYLDGQTPLKSSSSSDGAATDDMYDYPAGFVDQATGDRYTRNRLDAEDAVTEQLTGVGTCRGFTAGYQFQLSEYFRDELNGGWNIMRVRHTASQGSYVGSQTGQQSAKYVNDFTAISDAATYRPPLRAPRPIIHGTQTAIVVGPSGSEINVDKYGRVQVQFFWERTDKGDPGSSCWVRVATFWAGKQWGAIHIPRIGQEVIVAFEEGNPDRPIIVGSVYNPNMMPPYDLPANKSQSGIKSRSTEGGGTDDYNELRFEDKMGSEQIVMHAQKDMILEVENARTQTIGNTDSRTVTKGNDTVEVSDGNQTITVYGKRQVNARDLQVLLVHGDNVVQIKESGKYEMTIEQGGHSTELEQGDMSIQLDQGNYAVAASVGDIDLEAQAGNMTFTADVGQITIQALQSITLQCGQSSIQITPTGIQISGMMVSVEGQIQTQVSGIMTQVSGSAMTQISGGITMIG
jgi:type VI secretion system secreted protein VgrG